MDSSGASGISTDIDSAASPQDNFLYRNDGNSNAWLKVKLVGTQSNRSGIGANVRVTANIRGSSIRQLRQNLWWRCRLKHVAGSFWLGRRHERCHGADRVAIRRGAGTTEREAKA